MKLLTILSLACLLVAACCVDGTSNPNLECDATTPVVDGQQPDSAPPIDASVDGPVCGCPTLQPGDIFTVCGQTAIRHYIVDPQGEAMYFPIYQNSDVFASWRNNEEGLIPISQSCFDSLWVPVIYPSSVNYRPGSYLVKRVGTSTPIYVILPNNTLAPISATVAAELCQPADVGGVGCEPREIADTFWPSFTGRKPEITVAHIYPGLLFVIGNNSTVYNTDVNGIIHEVPNAAFELNHFQRRFVRRVPQSAVNGTLVGAPMRIYEWPVSDPTQGG